MKPYYETELGKLYHGDCLEIMPHLDPVDLVLTSPPYDNLRTYGGHKFNFEKTAESIKKTVANGGIIVWVVNDETINGSESLSSFKQAIYFTDKCKLNLHDTMIWNKASCRYPETNRYYPCFEYMFLFSNGRPKTYNLISDRRNIYSNCKVARKKQLRKVTGEIVENSAYRNDKNRRIKKNGVRFNLWNIPVSASVGDKTALLHPASFPEQLAQDHVLSWSNQNDVVLDPMSGSGTTLKIAERLNRKWIGIEIEEKYCEISAKRIEAEYKQRKLF